MLKFVVIGSASLSVLATTKTVSREIVKDIYEKTQSWEPMEVDQNPFKDYTIEELKGLLGTIKTNPTGLPSPFP
jgi:cathepsin B